MTQERHILPAQYLTKEICRRATAKGGKRTEYRDQKQPGLALRVSPAGTKSWTFRYRVAGVLKRSSLEGARYPTVTPAEARAKARAILASNKKAAPARGKSDPKRGPTLRQEEREVFWRTYAAEQQGIAESYPDPPSYPDPRLKAQERDQFLKEAVAKATAKWTARGEPPEVVEKHVEWKLRAVSVVFERQRKASLERQRKANAKDNLPEVSRLVLDAVDDYLSGGADPFKAVERKIVARARAHRGARGDEGEDEGKLQEAYERHVLEGKTVKQTIEDLEYPVTPGALSKRIKTKEPRLLANALNRRRK